MLKELKQIKVENPDIHPGTLGMKDGRYIYYDVSGTYSGHKRNIKIMNIDKIIDKINTQPNRPKPLVNKVESLPW